MEPPTRDPSDSLIAYGAESGLFMPEEAKSKALANRISAGPLLPEPIGVSISFGFYNGVESEQM